MVVLRKQVKMEGAEGSVRIGKRCFVGNLAWRTSWQDLKVKLTGHPDGCINLDFGSHGQDLPCCPQDKFRECGSVVYANVMRDDDGAGGVHLG